MCLTTGCRAIRASTARQTFPGLEADPTPEPDRADREAHARWLREYEQWGRVRCPCGIGYFCRRHGIWIPGEDVTSKLAPPQEQELDSYCPASHYYPDPESYAAESGQQDVAGSLEAGTPAFEDFSIDTSYDAPGDQRWEALQDQYSYGEQPLQQGHRGYSAAGPSSSSSRKTRRIENTERHSKTQSRDSRMGRSHGKKDKKASTSRSRQDPPFYAEGSSYPTEQNENVDERYDIERVPRSGTQSRSINRGYDDAEVAHPVTHPRSIDSSYSSEPPFPETQSRTQSQNVDSSYSRAAPRPGTQSPYIDPGYTTRHTTDPTVHFSQSYYGQSSYPATPAQIGGSRSSGEPTYSAAQSQPTVSRSYGGGSAYPVAESSTVTTQVYSGDPASHSYPGGEWGGISDAPSPVDIGRFRQHDSREHRKQSSHGASTSKEKRRAGRGAYGDPDYYAGNPLTSEAESGTANRQGGSQAEPSPSESYRDERVLAEGMRNMTFDERDYTQRSGNVSYTYQAQDEQDPTAEDTVPRESRHHSGKKHSKHKRR